MTGNFQKGLTQTKPSYFWGPVHTLMKCVCETRVQGMLLKCLAFGAWMGFELTSHETLTLDEIFTPAKKFELPRQLSTRSLFASCPITFLTSPQPCLHAISVTAEPICNHCLLAPAYVPQLLCSWYIANIAVGVASHMREFMRRPFLDVHPDAND
jgi:hypothetical protein